MKRTTKLNAEQVKRAVGSTDWQRLKSLSDDEVEAAAAADPDAKPFAPQELRKFKRTASAPTGKGSK